MLYTFNEWNWKLILMTLSFFLQNGYQLKSGYCKYISKSSWEIGYIGCYTVAITKDESA